MRVRARPGQRRMVLRLKFRRAVDECVADAERALAEWMRGQDYMQQFADGLLREWVKPIVADVVQAAQPSAADVSGVTSPRFAPKAQQWAGTA